MLLNVVWINDWLNAKQSQINKLDYYKIYISWESVIEHLN